MKHLAYLWKINPQPVNNKDISSPVIWEMELGDLLYA